MSMIQVPSEVRNVAGMLMSCAANLKGCADQIQGSFNAADSWQDPNRIRCEEAAGNNATGIRNYAESIEQLSGQMQRWIFEHCRKDDVKDFRNIATPIRKKIIKAGGKPWKLFFDSLRGSCMTEKENSRKFTQKDMDAMFGNSEAVRGGSYLHGRATDEEYVALAGLYAPAVLPAESAKKSPLISPYCGSNFWLLYLFGGVGGAADYVLKFVQNAL